jgi:hypothetical protein
MAYLQEGYPNYTQSGNLCAIPLKKVNTKLKTKKQQIVIKPVRDSSPKKALSIHTTSSTSQSRETVPLKSYCRESLSYYCCSSLSYGSIACVTCFVHKIPAA